MALGNFILLSMLCCFLCVSAARRQQDSPSFRDRIAALFGQDPETNQLRFFTGNSGSDITSLADVISSGSSSSSSSSSASSSSSGYNLNDLINQYITQKQDALEMLRPASSSSDKKITPIVIDLSKLSASSDTSVATSALTSLLPQIIQQALANQQQDQVATTTRRRSRRPANKPRQVFVLRPRANDEEE